VLLILHYFIREANQDFSLSSIVVFWGRQAGVVPDGTLEIVKIKEGTVAYRRACMQLALALALFLPWVAQAQEKPAELMSKFKVGDVAPDFTLPDQNNKPVKLSDYRGKKNVVLAFYVLAFTSG
jgi:hypothetical protein